MKTHLLLMLLSTNFVFSQLDESKDVNDSRLVSTNEIPKKIGNYRTEIKLSNKTLDTIQIYYNDRNTAKFISVVNKKKGINTKSFHLLSSHLNSGFRLTNSLNSDNREFFYDSKMRRLIVKIYSSKIKNKLIEVQFISDYEIIKSTLPEVSNW